MSIGIIKQIRWPILENLSRRSMPLNVSLISNQAGAFLSGMQFGFPQSPLLIMPFAQASHTQSTHTDRGFAWMGSDGISRNLTPHRQQTHNSYKLDAYKDCSWNFSNWQFCLLLFVRVAIILSGFGRTESKSREQVRHCVNCLPAAFRFMLLSYAPRQKIVFAWVKVCCKTQPTSSYVGWSRFITKDTQVLFQVMRIDSTL